MKKAFTLVELAIVLVIIGLIMGMAIKGKALIDVAKTRAELAKITQIQASVAAYVAKNNGREPVSMDNLTTASLLSTKDLWSNMANDNFTLGSCTFGSSKGVCVIGGADNKSFSKRLACHVEVSLDDEDVATGLGRDLATNGTGLAKADYENCDNKTNNAAYGYIVF